MNQASTSNDTKYFLLTIDVEDWFQVENFKPWIPFETWDQRELRVERNVHRLLDLFDSVELSQKKYPQNPACQGEAERRLVNPVGENKRTIQATFFVLGWIAEKLPHLVREIHNRGHEVASHGNNHLLSNQIPNNNLKAELRDSKKLLEDIIASSISGFRAPSFSISNSVIEHISDAGYLYDSSYNSFNAHERYGQLSLSVSPNNGIAYKIWENFYELPISNLEFGNTISYRLSAMSSGRNEKKRFVLPWGGGAYFRLIPYRLFRKGIELILKKYGAYLFYMHPWELDIDQPRVTQASYIPKFRHYSNIDKTTKRLEKLIKEFNGCRFITCREYLKI